MAWKELSWTCDECGSDGSYIGKSKKWKYVGNIFHDEWIKVECDCPTCLLQRRYFRDEVKGSDGLTWSQKLANREPKLTEQEYKDGYRYYHVNGKWKLLKE